MFNPTNTLLRLVSETKGIDEIEGKIVRLTPPCCFDAPSCNI